MPSPTAIVIEDEPQIRRFVRGALGAEGWAVHEAGTLREGLTAAGTRQPDLLVLDLGLPDGDGVSLIRDVRGWSAVPIIVLSARTDEADKIAALDAGADDYLTKPFSVEELLARVRVALRRLAYDEPAPAAEVYRNGGLAIDFDSHVVTRDGEEVHLTPIEYKLLALLARHTGKVLTHNYILKEVWGQALASDLPSLRVFMATLRKKIEPDPANPRYLQTHVGVGYRMMRVD